MNVCILQMLKKTTKFIGIVLPIKLCIVLILCIVTMLSSCSFSKLKAVDIIGQ